MYTRIMGYKPPQTSEVALLLCKWFALCIDSYSNNFIHDSKWTFVPYLIKCSQDSLKYSVHKNRIDTSDTVTLNFDPPPPNQI